MIQSIEGFSWLISVVGVPFGWFMLNKIQELKKEVSDHKLFCAEHYQSKSELSEFKKEMRSILNEFKDDVHKQLDRIEKSVNK